tara:strand:+ start:1943 stop:2827 length:885 start_codon:yes stop_codon:yes gene_type:complete
MKNSFLLIGILFLLSSCIKNNPDPSWISIEEWSLVANPALSSEEKVLTHNITDAWVFVNGETIGVFELPINIPVLVSGNANIQVFPAVLNNGISATKKIYPFLEPHVVQADLVQNETLNIFPVTMYSSSTKFNIEDFEGASNVVTEGPSSNVIANTSTDPLILDPAINETKFLKVDINSSNDRWIASTKFNLSSINMPLPKGQEVYLEIDYYNTNQVTSGLIGISATNQVNNPNVRLNPQDLSEIKWKKIYIDLREVVSGLVSADYFEFSFDALLDDGQSSGIVCLDNMKAVYF